MGRRGTRIGVATAAAALLGAAALSSAASVPRLSLAQPAGQRIICARRRTASRG